MKTGVDLIAEERSRQIHKEGFDDEHDSAHENGELGKAAACYALEASGVGTEWPNGIKNGSALFWPWDKPWWKPKGRVRDLIRAGALIAAEIDRIRRQSQGEKGDFCCPDCGSSNLQEIGYEDDFGSMLCHDCGYQGDPGEDFPTVGDFHLPGGKDPES